MGRNMKNNYKNMLTLLEENTIKYGEKTALGIKSPLGWKEFSYKGLGLMSRKLASYLINDLQVTKDERLAILSESKPEYGACVFASVISGMITVPLDNKLTIYELESILSDCRPTVLMVSQSYIEKALHLKKTVDSIKTIIVMDEPTYNLELPSMYTLPDNYNCKWKHRYKKSTALIIYTSGTTGAPKGVEITFGNMFAQLIGCDDALKDIIKKQSMNILSILPMNHLFEMTVGFSTFLNHGFSVYYTSSLKPKDILGIMKEKQVEFMIVVPAFLKLLKTSVDSKVKELPLLPKTVFKIMYEIARFIPFYRVKKFMFKSLHKTFGGHLEGFVAGGAPLEKEVGTFFERIGLRVYQGYGLTETSPVVAVNRDKYFRDMTSVGVPLKGFEARIDETNGELLLKGPSVMKGYYNQPELTAQVIDADGWLHTGDIAKIGKNGHIYITGRIKNMIVLSGGKKVFPEEVEAVLEQSEYFAEVCVLGAKRTFGSKDGTEDIIAVVVPKQEVINKYPDSEELNKFVRAEVKKHSTRLTLYKRPVNIMVLKDPLPRTTTRKVKRNAVKELVHI